MDERKTAFELCLTCPMKVGFILNDTAWWQPMCQHWSKAKTDHLKNIYYGPQETCIYKLEHVILDERKNFKVRDEKLYVYFLNYVETNKLHFVIQDSINTKTKIRFKQIMFLEDSEVVNHMKKNAKLTINDMERLINEFLKVNDLKSLGSHFRYHQVKKVDGQWELGLIDARSKS